MNKLLLLALGFASVANAQLYNQTNIPLTIATNTVVGNGTSATAAPTALAVGTCSTSSSAVNWTTNTGFGCNTAINAATSTGVTNASAASAGVVGEMYTMNCPAPTSATITMTIATPAVVTWSSHPFAAVGAANFTCAINFTTTGALPTGVVAATNYYIIGSSLSGDTFQIADTPGHALAATNAINTSGSQSGTQTGFMGALSSTGNPFAGAGMSLVAGDWDCSGTVEWGNVTAVTATLWAAGIGSAVSLTAPYAQIRVASGSISTNNYFLPAPIAQVNISSTTATYLVATAGFSGGSQNAGGFLRCRRMR